MRIEFACPFCRKPHTVGPELAGRRGRCKDCGTVMRIPAECSVSSVEGLKVPKPPATRVVSRAEAVQRPSPPLLPPSPPRSRPHPEPDPIVMVEDPYALADEHTAPASRQRAEPAGVGVVDQDFTPLPRAGVGPSAKKKRRKGDEGPWGVPARRTAMKLMAIAFIQIPALASIRTGGLPNVWSVLKVFGALEAAVLMWIATVLTFINLFGSAVRLSQGNRRAFSGESALGQCGWIVTILMSGMMVFYALTSVLTAGQARLRSLDARLSATERIDTVVYDRLIGDLLADFDRMAGLLETPVGPNSPRARTIQTAFSDLERDIHRIMSEASATPMPTRGQVKLLFDRYHGRFHVALTRVRRGFHDFVDHSNLPPDVDAAKSLEKTEADFGKLVDAYNAHYPAGATDASGWYFAVFGAGATSRR